MVQPNQATASTEQFQQERDWHRASALYLAEAGLFRAAVRCLRCHDPEYIAAYHVCREHPEHYIQPLFYACHLPICPTCSRYRANQFVRSYSETVRHYAENGRYKFSPRHMVLTTPYGLDDPAHRSAYRVSWATLPKTLNAVLLAPLKHELSPAERHKGRIRLTDHQVGYLAAADWGENGKLHFHSLIDGPYIPHDLLREQWERFAPGAPRDVWLDKVAVSENDIDSTIAYVTTLNMVPPARTPQLLTMLAKQKRVRSAGVFYGNKPPPRRAECICLTCGARLMVTGQQPDLPHLHHPERIARHRRGQPHLS